MPAMTVGSGMVLCGRQEEMYVGCNSTQVTKQASKLRYTETNCGSQDK